MFCRLCFFLIYFVEIAFFAGNHPSFVEKLSLNYFFCKFPAETEEPYELPALNYDDFWTDGRTFDFLAKSCDFDQTCGFGSSERKWRVVNYDSDENQS